jgi:hypothetical protein
VNRFDLASDSIREAADAVSSGGRYWFTRRNLFYELQRRSTLPDAGGDPGAEAEAFARALDEFEARDGVLPMLVRPERAPRRFDLAALPPDVLDYAVPRSLVFERLDPLLAFVQNGFHRKLEVAMILLPDYPEHVAGSLRRQLQSGFSTRFFAVHDATARGYSELERIAAELGSPDHATFIDLGLTLPWAFRLRLPLRVGEKLAVAPTVRERDRVLLEQGRYAEFEALPPRDAMQWVYERIADEAEEVGFG